MDSGDHSNNQLKAPDSGFSGGFRSQSFSNLFQGFFGVKHTPTSMTDITSVGVEGKSSEAKSLETIVSPSHDEGWILSHFLQAKREKEDDRNLRRNVTCSELEKSVYPQLHGSASSASFTTDASRTDLAPVPRIYESDGESSGSELGEKGEESAMPRIVVAKHMRHPHYQRNILSTFLSRDLPHSEMKRNEQMEELEQSQHDANTRLTQGATPVTGEATGLGDRLDGSLLPVDATSGDRIPESKQQTLRDLLWIFNHEKINVSKKEMNLIASIDQ